VIQLRAYAGSLLAFLLIDAVWLGLISPGFYASRIGHLMRDDPSLVTAAGFYLVYVAGIVILAVSPALTAASWRPAAFRGAVLGLVAYGTYYMTNLAVMRDWPLSVTLVDMAWGTALTALAAVCGFLAARASR
jgi:uncharacterized membrane protein